MLYSQKMSSSAKTLRTFSWLDCISGNSFGYSLCTSELSSLSSSANEQKLSVGDAPMNGAACAAII